MDYILLLAAACIVTCTGTLGYLLIITMSNRHQRDARKQYIYASLEVIAYIIIAVGHALSTINAALAGYAWFAVILALAGCFLHLLHTALFTVKIIGSKIAGTASSMVSKKAHKIISGVNNPGPVET